MKKMIDCTNITNYLTEKARMTQLSNDGMCHLMCADCPLSTLNNGTGMVCKVYESQYPEIAIRKVQSWSDSHPKKTYLTQFLDNYPDAELGGDGTPKKICPHDLGLNDIEVCAPGERHCAECWNQIID